MKHKINDSSSYKMEIISASEISQFLYCSISWHLQRCGYKPKSDLLETGIKRHTSLGKTISYIGYELQKSRRLALAGYLLIAVSLSVIILWVIILVA